MNNLNKLPSPKQEDRIPDSDLTPDQKLVHIDHLSFMLGRAVKDAAFQAEIATRRTRELERKKQEHAEKISRLHREATHDSLTGLHNRKVLEEDGEATQFFEANKGKPAYAAVLDMDGLKGINDVYGHPAGDTVIEIFARACKESIRFSGETEENLSGKREGEGADAKDYAIRTGGDEVFFVGLGDLETGHMIMERIVEKFDELQQRETPNLPRLTCSYGVVEFSDGDVGAAMEAADDVARAAKDQHYKETGNIRRR